MTNNNFKASPTQFLSTYERSDVVREADKNVGRRLKDERIVEGRLKNDRKAPRRKTNKAVKIGLAKSKFWIKGTQNNISTLGAKVTLPCGLNMSYEVILYDEIDGHIIHCELVRSELDHIGVRFLDKKIKVFPKDSKFFVELSLRDARKLIAKQKENTAKLKNTNNRSTS